MPNPTPAEYTVQLGPTVTPEVAGELAAWAALAKISTSKMTRRAIDTGLEVLRSKLSAELGEMPASLLAEHVAEAARRGDRQVKRRRDYDASTRTPIAMATAAPVKPKRSRSKSTAA